MNMRLQPRVQRISMFPIAKWFKEMCLVRHPRRHRVALVRRRVPRRHHVLVRRGVVVYRDRQIGIRRRSSNDDFEFNKL